MAKTVTEETHWLTLKTSASSQSSHLNIVSETFWGQDAVNFFFNTVTISYVGTVCVSFSKNNQIMIWDSCDPYLMSHINILKIYMRRWTRVIGHCLWLQQQLSGTNLLYPGKCSMDNLITHLYGLPLLFYICTLSLFMIVTFSGFCLISGSFFYCCCCLWLSH